MDYLNFPPEVMLAKGEMSKPIEFYQGWHIQEKSDGIRALVVKQGEDVEVFGRNQTKKGRACFTQSLPEIVDMFKNFPDDFVLDCELMSSDFLTLQTKVRTIKTVVYDPFLYIKAFDLLYHSDEPLILSRKDPHQERYLMLLDFVDFVDNKALKPIYQFPDALQDQEHLDACLEKVLLEGGEGLIIKNPNAPYQCGKRSSDWIKVLPHPDMDVMFTGVVEGEGKYVENLGALVALPLEDYIQGDDARQFNVGTGFTDEFRTKIWNDRKFLFPIRGKVKYKNLYPSGIPRMPVFKSFNED